ncbi:MAG: methyltransferase domain-containing protein, partial [Candidatus Methylomirabilales bacterium]
LGFEAYLADCQSLESLSSLGLDAADLVVAGELIEHLDRPGSFLEAIRCLVRPDGLLALTTPNASRLINFIAALLGREVVNADHVGWQTWRTMRTLLERHDWELREFSYYANPALVRSERSRTESLKIGTINAFRFGARILFKLRPSLADGMIAVAVPRSAI